MRNYRYLCVLEAKSLKKKWHWRALIGFFYKKPILLSEYPVWQIGIFSLLFIWFSYHVRPLQNVPFCLILVIARSGTTKQSRGLSISYEITSLSAVVARATMAKSARSQWQYEHFSKVSCWQWSWWIWTFYEFIKFRMKKIGFVIFCLKSKK